MIKKYTSQNTYLTVTEALEAILEERFEWISRFIRIEKLSDLISISIDDFCYPMASSIPKATLFNGDDFIKGNDGKLFKEIEKRIYRIEKSESPVENITYLQKSNKAGIWIATNAKTFAVIWLKGIEENPMLFVKTHLQTVSGEQSIALFFINKESISKVVKYFQNIMLECKSSILRVIDGADQEVGSETWDGLILDSSITFLVKNDLESFLSKKSWFLEKNIPYRRGYLLHGPPGNGKTSVIKAMINSSGLPAYTMKYFSSQEAPRRLDEMFYNASSIGGALVLLEDIDRSFPSKLPTKDSEACMVSMSNLLNCLDGVSDSSGLVIVATANNPKALDHAILERPGRFDRVVAFPNPTQDLRVKYFMKMSPDFDPIKLEGPLGKCSNMSFAQLRETYILANQIALDEEREVAESDVGLAAEKLNYNISQADGRKSAGF